MKKSIAFISLSLLLAFQALGGWHLVTAVHEDGSITEEHTYIQGNKVKFSSTDGFDIIIDSETKEIMIVDNTLKAYWSGRIENLQKEMDDFIQYKIMEALKDVPEEQKEMVRQMMIASMKGQDTNPDEMYKVKIVETDETKQLLSYTCTKFEVHVNDVLTEELWISKEVMPYPDGLYDLFKDIDLGQVLDYEDTDAYRQIYQKGFVLYSKRFETDAMGGKDLATQEVMHIVDETIDEQTFLPGEGYTSYGLAEILIEQDKRKEE